MGTVCSTPSSAESKPKIDGFYLDDESDNSDKSESKSIMTRILNCGECGGKNPTDSPKSSFVKKGAQKKSPYYWLQYEDAFDMNQVHSLEGPYIGTSYWEDNVDTQTATHTSTRNNDKIWSRRLSSPTFPELLSETDSSSSSAYMMEDDYDRTPRIRLLGDDSITTAMTTLPTLGSSQTMGDLSVKSSSTSNVMVTFTPKRLMDNSRHGHSPVRDDHRFHHLDDRDDPDEHDDQFLNPPSPIRNTQLFPSSPPQPYDQYNHHKTDDTVFLTPDRSVATTTLASKNEFCGAFLKQYGTDAIKKIRDDKNNDDQSILIKHGVLIRGIIATPSTRSFGSCASQTYHIPDGIRDLNKPTRRHVNTLPSFREGHPIRIRMTESYAGFTSHSSPLLLNYSNVCQSNTNPNCFLSKHEQENLHHQQRDDIFSYDPLFSKGQYTICTPNGHLYGNGLNVTMGPKFMTLQDKSDEVFAVTRSRKTFIPSHIIYSPKPRYEGQTPSSHRPEKNYPHHNNYDSNEEDASVLDVYPWALIQKKGRKMEHEVTIHYVKDPTKAESSLTENSGNSNNNNTTGKNGTICGIFDAKPTFRARHGFDGQENHTHTIVSRITSTDKSVPCCIILRNPISRDLFDITIAPGIDPLLVICYFTIHSRMDVEPILSDM